MEISDSCDALTALSLEARRRHMTYGQLVSRTTARNRQSIIRQYVMKRTQKTTETGKEKQHVR